MYIVNIVITKPKTNISLLINLFFKERSFFYIYQKKYISPYEILARFSLAHSFMIPINRF